MNPKIKKLRAEQKRLREKITELQRRDKDLEKEIRDLENLDIIGLVRAKGFTLEEFSALIKQLERDPIPNDTIQNPDTTEEDEDYDFFNENKS